MTLKYTLAASALALGICMAAPAYAQQASNSQTGAIAGLSAVATTTSTDLNMQDSNNDNSVSVADSGNDNSDNSLNVADSGNDNSDNSTNDSGNLAFALGSFNSDSSDNSTNDSNNGNDSSSIVAAQTLVANVTNNAPVGSALFQVGSDNHSGDNSVAGSAFAAYAGILNNGWNTGINSSAQAATNVAARGSVTFGN